MSNVIELRPPQPAEDIHDIHRDLAQARQELTCAVTTLSVAEDHGFTHHEAQASALRVTERCLKAIDAIEDRLDAWIVRSAGGR
jgi:hypothetical protein